MPALDGARGLAIALVLIAHLCPWQMPTRPLDRLLSIPLGLGWIGVDLFFVLSGFLITGILIESRESPRYFSSFYARRALRIFPLYYAYLALVFWLLPLARHEVPIFAQSASDRWYWWAYVGNFLLAKQGAWETGHRWVQHFWSLAVEEQFYLLWPFVVRAQSRTGLARTCVAILIACPLARIALWCVAPHPEVAGYVGPVWRMDGLAAGALLAVVARESGGLVARRRVLAALAVTAAASFCLVLRSAHSTSYASAAMQTAGLSAIAVLFASLLGLALATSHGAVRGALEWGALRFLGRYSYGIYVLHSLIAALLAQYVFGRALELRSDQAQWPVVLGYLVVCTAVSILAALGSWHFLEKRFVRRKALFVARPPAARIAEPQEVRRGAWSGAESGSGPAFPS